MTYDPLGPARLPHATPGTEPHPGGIGGHLLTRCWKDNCDRRVAEHDPVGLCQMHRDDLTDLDQIIGAA